MTDNRRIVAVGLLTEYDLTVLGQGFKYAYPIDTLHGFDDLLVAIDEAERPSHPASAE